jgi:hypothetical protein
MAHRSSITGRYVSTSSAARHPKTSVTDSGANKSNGMHHRSAITGHLISATSDPWNVAEWASSRESLPGQLAVYRLLSPLIWR